MPTVRDLYQTVAADTSIKLQESRHICRVMQQAGLQPTGRRGGWKDTPTINVEHCVSFLFALAGTRTGFPRTAEGVRRSVQMFETLTAARPRGEEGLTRLAAQLVKEIRLISENRPGWRPTHLVFRNHEMRPHAEIQYIGELDKDFTTGFSGFEMTEREEGVMSSTGLIANCLYMDSKILHVFAKMFSERWRPDDDDDRGDRPA